MNIFKQISGQGQDVVVIHGTAASHLDVSPIANELAKAYRVSCVDLPGTGQSTGSDSIKTIHDIADALLNDLPEQATYVGCSFGGLVAQSIAARYPERVKHLIGVTTTPKFIADTNWIGVPQPGFGAFINPLLAEGKNANDFLQMLYESEFSQINPKPALYHEAQKIWQGKLMISNALLAKRIAICDATDLRGLFKTISCPIHLIMGEQDGALPKEAWAQIKKLNANAHIHEIIGAQHLPFWTHPKEFNSVLNTIVSETNYRNQTGNA